MLIVQSLCVFVSGNPWMHGLAVAISVFWIGVHTFEISDEEDFKRKKEEEKRDYVLP